MRIMVAYDQNGNIVRVATVRTLPEGLPHPFGDLTETDRVLSIDDPSPELLQADLSEIQGSFRVDPNAQALVPRQ